MTACLPHAPLPVVPVPVLRYFRSTVPHNATFPDYLVPP